MRRRWQNKIAESSVTLPTVCVIVTLLWWLPLGSYSTAYLLGWVSCVFTAYIVIETAATCALLRIRSRMVTSLLLLLLTGCGFLHPLQTGTLVLLAMAAAVFCLQHTSEQLRPEADTLHAYALLAVASLLWSPLLLLAPMMLWCQLIYLRSLRLKSFGAALIGLALPYLFWAVGAFTLGRMEPFVAHTTTILSPLTAPFWWQWAIDLAQTYDAQSFWPLFREGLQTRLYHHWPEASALILQTALSLTGFVHYVRCSFDDKINVRMYHYVYLTLYVVLALWLCWQPQHTTILLPLLILTGTPSAAHFITFTHSRLTNAWTILLTLAWIAVAFVCLALPSILSWPMPQIDLNLPFP